MPYKMIKTTKFNRERMEYYGSTEHILHLPGGKRIITYSDHGSFRVWNLEMGTQVGGEWENRETRVKAIELSPDSKTIATGSEDGAVRLWNIDTGKVIKKWTGHTTTVNSVCWSSDGGRVVSGSEDATFRVWDVERGRIILGPIKAGESMNAVCYSPDAKMIATGGDDLKVWDASTGKLVTTIFEMCGSLAWTSDGKTLIVAGGVNAKKFDTTTWSETAILHSSQMGLQFSLSPNERILAGKSFLEDKTVKLWNLETNHPIEPPLHHKGSVLCAAFSADGMFLSTGCTGMDGAIYTWDLSAIIKEREADLLSNNVNATRRPAPKITGAPPRRIPPGFFDDERCADLSSTPPRQRRFPSFWRRRFNRNGVTERGTQSWPSPFSWTRNLVSDMVRRRDGLDIELRDPPIVEVPCTAGKPRNYHARKKKSAASTSQRAYAHPTQQPPPIATASTLPAVAGAAGTTGAITRPHIPITGWRVRLLTWVCCIPIQNAN